MATNLKHTPVYVQRPARRPVDVETTAVDGVGRMLGTRIWNVSDGGFMAECEERLPIGRRSSLSFRAAARSAPKCAGCWVGASGR